MISQVDQSCLGLFAHSVLSIAVNPDTFNRKVDIKNKLSKKGRNGGAKKEFRIIRYYVPVLLNDLYLERELETRIVKKPKSFSKLKCDCKYCSQLFQNIDSEENRKKRHYHFLFNLHRQIFELKNSSNKLEKFEESIIT